MKNEFKKQLLASALVVGLCFGLASCTNAVKEVEETAAAESVVESVVESVEESAVVEESSVEAADETVAAEDSSEVTDDSSVVADDASEVSDDASEVSDAVEATAVGEGETQFTFEVVDGEGNTTYFAVNTDKTTVGEALVDCNLVEGDESEYGLYVKVVNGITADYDVDQTYWAFYVNGEYATTGVDSTEVVAGNVYSFKVEKQKTII